MYTMELRAKPTRPDAHVIMNTAAMLLELRTNRDLPSISNARRSLLDEEETASAAAAGTRLKRRDVSPPAEQAQAVSSKAQLLNRYHSREMDSLVPRSALRPPARIGAPRKRDGSSTASDVLALWGPQGEYDQL